MTKPVTLLLRAILACGSAAILIWSIGEIRAATRYAALESVSRRMVVGYEFNPKTVSALVPVLAAVDSERCGVALAWSGMISMRLAQDSKAAGAAAEEAEHADRTRRHLERYLTCAPTDGYAWLLLFWSKYTDKRDPSFLPLLARSYELAPREGWMMPVRNSVAMPLYGSLDEDMKRRVREEYAALARERPDAAAALYTNQSEEGRAILNPILADTPPEQRKEILIKLDHLGFELPIKVTR